MFSSICPVRESREAVPAPDGGAHSWMGVRGQGSGRTDLRLTAIVDYEPFRFSLRRFNFPTCENKILIRRKVRTMQRPSQKSLIDLIEGIRLPYWNDLLDAMKVCSTITRLSIKASHIATILVGHRIFFPSMNPLTAF